MLSLPPAARIFFCLVPADLRRSFDGLLTMADKIIRQDPFSGDLELCHQLIEELYTRLDQKETFAEKLPRQLEQLFRRRYGQRSDRVSSSQLPLFEPGAEEEAEAKEFVESESSDDWRALPAVAWIKRLYAVEHEARERGLDAGQLRELRREKTPPLLEGFGAWLRTEQEKVLPKGPLGQAIAYTLSNWSALNRYVDDGILDIDNNAAERAVRGIAVGRKNWLFAGSDRGGRAAAVLISFT